MDQTPATVLDFVKAVSDADRLRIIGELTRADASPSQLADRLGMPFREAFNHLAMLEFVGVVHQTGDTFSLDQAALEKLSKEQFAGQRANYSADPASDDTTRKVLSAYLNADGSLKQLPAQPSKQRVILEYLLPAFEPGVSYTEKEVNSILRRFHPDTASLRRALVDAGMLSREGDGSRYWKNVANDPD